MLLSRPTIMANIVAFPGRFQPFCLHHALLASEIFRLHEPDQLYVVVADWHGPKNAELFLPGNIAVDLANLSLADVGLSSKAQAVGLYLAPHFPLEDTLGPLLKNLQVSKVFSGSEKTLQAISNINLSSESHMSVFPLTEPSTSPHATHVRHSLQANTSVWRDLVTPSVAKYLLDHPELVAELKSLPETTGDKRPWSIRSEGSNSTRERR